MIKSKFFSIFFGYFLIVHGCLCANWQQNLKNLVSEARSPRWMHKQIEEDFNQCNPASFSRESRNQFKEEYWSGEGFDFLIVYTVIRSGKPQFTPIGAAGGRALSSIENAIKRLCSILPLPDVEFAISLSDGVGHNVPFPIPIFVFAKTGGLHDLILMPDWEIFEGYDHFLAEIKKATSFFSWEKRKEKAIWRGATTGGSWYTKENYRTQLRTKLVESSFDYPDLIDARFTSICQSDEELKGIMKPYLGKSMNVYEQLRYKYQILIDGNTCSFSRAYWQLLSGSLIFKQDSPYTQWYYGALKPYSHYIPFAHDSSDLAKKIEFARKNDRQMQQIAENARAFAQNNLKTEDVYLYFYLVIQELAKRQAEVNSN